MSSDLVEPRAHTASVGLATPPAEVARRVEPFDHLLLWQAHGTSTVVIEREIVRLRQDQSVWVSAGDWHRLQVGANSVTLPLFFPVAVTSTALCSGDRFDISGVAKVLCLAVMQAQNTLIQSGANVRQQLLSALQTAPLIDAVAWPRSGPARAVAEQLVRNPADPRRIVEWAEHLHVSVRSLERSFRTQTGMPFRQWRLERRMAAAEHLIKRGMPSSEVARRVGYDTHSAFSRAFRVHFGTAPSSYA